MLSDMGAEIIKIEHREGERGRWAASGQPQPVPYFVAHDRGKNSVTLDVRKPEARAVVMKFVERVDVVVSNMRPGAMSKLGLAYDALRTANDQIIYARASAFGPNGERTTLPSTVSQPLQLGFDLTGPCAMPGKSSAYSHTARLTCNSCGPCVIK